MKNGTVHTLSSLKVGDTAVIDSFTDNFISLKLMEMGCVPGEKVRVHKKAPLGDPIAISVSGYLLSLRKAEAAAVVVTSWKKAA